MQKWEHVVDTADDPRDAQATLQQWEQEGYELVSATSATYASVHGAEVQYTLFLKRAKA